MAKYTITSNSGMVPNQIFGTTDEGKWFYFRGRHDFATLHIADSEEQWFKSDDDFIVWEEEVDGAGWFELDEFEALFWQVIEELEKSKK